MRKLFFIFSFLFFSTTLIAEEQKKDSFITSIKSGYFFSCNTRLDVEDENIQMAFPYFGIRFGLDLPIANRFLIGIEDAISYDCNYFDVLNLNLITFDFAPKIGIYNKFSKNFINFNIYPIYIKYGYNFDTATAFSRTQLSTAISCIFAREINFKTNEKETNYLGVELFAGYNFKEILDGVYNYISVDNVHHKIKGFTFGVYFTIVSSLSM